MALRMFQFRLRGRPPGLAAGISGSSSSHWSEVRLLAYAFTHGSHAVRSIYSVCPESFLLPYLLLKRPLMH